MQKFLKTRDAQADYSVTSAVEEETTLTTRENQKILKSMEKQLMSETGADVKLY